MTTGNVAATDTGQRLRLGLLALASFTIVLDLAGVVILLPSIQVDLAVDLSAATWVIAGFTLAWAASVPLGFSLATRHSPRRVLGLGLGCLAAASTLAALAPSWPVLVGARMAQGVAAAVVSSSVWVTTQDPTRGPSGEQAARAVGAGALLGAALGPVLPGMLAIWTSWRAQFWLECALAVVLAAAAYRLMPTTSRSTSLTAARRLLATTQVLGVLAIAGASVAVIEAPSHGWTSPAFLLEVGISVLSGAGFVRVQLRGSMPRVGLRLLRRRTFGVGNALRGITEFSSVGIFLPMSGYLQLELDRSPLAAGLILLPIIGGAILTAPVAETLDGRIDRRWLLIPGFLLVAAGTTWLAQLREAPSWWFFVLPLLVVGAGTGALETPTEGAIRGGTPAGAEGPAWVVSQVTYLLGVGAGIAVTSAVWEAAGADSPQGVRAALYVCAAVAAIGAGLATLLNDRSGGG